MPLAITVENDNQLVDCDETKLYSLPDGVITKILRGLSIKDAANASAACASFCIYIQDHVESNVEKFFPLFTKMIRAYYLFHEWFTHYPDGEGYGDDIQMSILVDGKQIFWMSNKVHIIVGKYEGNLNMEKIASATLSGHTCKIEVTFIHSHNDKTIWINDLSLFKRQHDEAKELLKGSEYQDKYEDEDFIKYIMVYLMISRYKTVYETRGKDGEFVRIPQLPYNLNEETVAKLAKITEDVNEELVDLGMNPISKLHEPLKYLNTYESLISDVPGLENSIPSLTVCDRDERNEDKKARLEAYNSFSKSVTNLVNFINNPI
jgi:hypothetical protein